MKIYLAAPTSSTLGSRYLFKKSNNKKPCILESFFYVTKWLDEYITHEWDFLLDSGAFTYMTSKKKETNVDWEDYIDRYAAYINRLDIEKFFELDIDSVVGIKEVLRIRAKLERLTQKRCIPVWHRARGKQAFIDMCKDYDYVAIGGIVSKEIKRKEHPVFRPLINIAHKHNAKIHGLGYTNLAGLKKYKFDSVDSTNWTYGGQYSLLYHFNGVDFDQHKIVPRIIGRVIEKHNIQEWLKFQRYARHHL